MQIPSLMTLLPILIALIALWVAVRGYRRKAGIEIRGSFQITSSRACEDRYVSNILIENVKDRSTTIFDIYLRVGYSVYIHLVEFDESPMILKPYETYQKQFGPIEFYTFNLHRVNINRLLSNNKLRKRLVLSTSDGKYVVPKRIKAWNPVVEFFNNNLTCILRPIQSRYKGTDLGGNMRYAVEIMDVTDKTQIIPVGRNDYDIGVFRNFRLSKESLESAEALESFLSSQKASGKFPVHEFAVHDINVWRAENHKDYNNGKSVVTIGSDPFVRYYIIGRLLTYWQTRKMRQKNRRLAKRKRQ